MYSTLQVGWYSPIQALLAYLQDRTIDEAGMNYPQIEKAASVVEGAKTTLRQHRDGRWLPARTLKIERRWPWSRLAHRLKLAFNVFTGRYDALDWEDQQAARRKR